MRPEVLKISRDQILNRAMSCRAMVLGKFQYRDLLLIWIIVGQGITVITVTAGEGCCGYFFSRLSYLFCSFFSLEDGTI